MGAYLSQPITEKEIEDGGDENGLRWGAAGMQGWRTGMEDSHLACLDFGGQSEESTNSERSDPPLAAFAVFDGHGGAEVAKYCSAHICKVLKESSGFKESNYEQGLRQTFLRMDELLRSPGGQERYDVLLNREGAWLLNGRVHFVKSPTGNYIAATRVKRRNADPPAMVAAMMRPGPQRGMNCDVLHLSLGHTNDDNARETAKLRGIKAELLKLKEEGSSSKGSKADSDSDNDNDGGGDSDVLSKIDRETQKQIMERMRKAMSEKFLSHGVELGVSGLVEGAADKEEESGDDDDDDSEDSSGSENDDDDDVDEGEGEGTHKKEASAASGGETESEGTRRSDELTPKAESLAVVGAQKTKETGGGVVLLNGSAPLAEGAHALTTSAIAPSALASVSVSVPPVGGEGDGVGNRDHEGDRDGDLVARKKLVGGEEWGNAALKLDVDEAAAPASGTRQRYGFDCGATAVMGLLVGGKTLVVANAGDSRCVVSRKGVAVDMSEDHKPEDEVELSRIEKAGGAVVDGRVQGNLNLSRAIGDLMYKVDETISPEEQMITADPDLRTLEITDEDEFIVLACDGVWNSLSSQETINLVRERLRGSASTLPHLPLSNVCADLCDACCAETADGDGTGLDNVTVVLVELHTRGARALTGRAAAKVAIADSAADAECSGDMDLSDDGKRKQGDGDGGGVKERSGKLMRSAVEAGAEGGSGD